MCSFISIKTKGKVPHAPRLVNSRDAYRAQNPKKLALKVVERGLRYYKTDFLGIIKGKKPKSNIWPI